ncbi:MAG: class I SAM-dependent methyltransferase [Candidatus Syntropharchaeia archaeon]
MEQLQLVFEKGDKILEIGGGAEGRALFHPNVDIREGPGVDYVLDVGKDPLPFDDESFDGVFGKFVIEHISWRNVPQFIRECYRILKPGANAIFITSNTYEQCKKIAEAGDEGFNEDLVCMLFGGQGEDEGYEAGSHKAGFSPSYAVKLFREAGFSEVWVYELPGCKTDMIIKARK